MELSCRYRPFNKDWDEKLKYIINNYKSYEVDTHTIKFKVLSGTSLFGVCKMYNTYTVWISNKDYAYGHLREFNGHHIPSENSYAPSKETMMLLFNLEKPFNYDEVYK